MKYFFYLLLIPSLFLSQSEYKYDSKRSDLPNWVNEMYKDEPNPGKVESLYKNYYKEN